MANAKTSKWRWKETFGNHKLLHKLPHTLQEQEPLQASRETVKTTLNETGTSPVYASDNHVETLTKLTKNYPNRWRLKKKRKD
jgi:hypothetical protein